MKSKTADSTIAGLKSILEEGGQYPRTIFADKGGEIKNRKMRLFLEENNIKLIFAENQIHAPFIERFNQTLVNSIY